LALKCWSNETLGSVIMRPTYTVRSQVQVHRGATELLQVLKGVKTRLHFISLSL